MASTSTAEEDHGQVWQESGPESEEGHARAQTRDPQERPIRQEGQEPQAGDRNRPGAGAPRRRKGAAEEVQEEILTPARLQSRPCQSPRIASRCCSKFLT